MKPSKIGFIGLGNMGRPMATRLLDNGFPLVVYDTRPEAMAFFEERGAVAAKSAAQLGAQVDVVLVSLPTPDVVRSVVIADSAFRADAAFHTYVDLSTIGVATSREVARCLHEAGIDVLDAPVTGGVPGAERGALTIMVSGAPSVVDTCRPIFNCIAKAVLHVGDAPGLGQAMKLINNLLSATAMVATSEAMTLGVKAGLHPATMLEVLNSGSGRNSATQDKFPRAIVTRTFDYGFRTALMCKDVRLCMEMAEQLQVPMIIGSNVRQLWSLAMNEMGPDNDFTTVVQCMERWAGVTVDAR